MMSLSCAGLDHGLAAVATLWQLCDGQAVAVGRRPDGLEAAGTVPWWGRHYRGAMRRCGRQGQRSSRRWLRARITLIACAIALLTAGCVEAAWNVVVHDDGSGTFEWRYGFDDDVVELDVEGEGAAMPAACLQLIRKFEGAGPVQPRIASVETRVQSRHADGRCSYVATTSWSSDESEKVFAALADNRGPKFRRIAGGGWEFELDTGFIGDYLELGGPPFEVVGGLRPTFALSLTLPGTALQHNADSSEGSTLVWVIDLSEPDDIPKVLHAGTTGDANSTLIPVIGGVLFVIVLAFAARAKWRKRRARRSP